MVEWNTEKRTPIYKSRNVGERADHVNENMNKKLRTPAW